MDHDIFISYSVEDKAVADAVCATLESRKIPCWVAPRDISPGQNFAEAIIDAINQSHIMVVVLSSASNTSQYVCREVERAVSKAIPIVTLRVEDVELTKSMELYLSSTHWLDAITPPIETHLEKLAQILETMESVDPVEAKERPPKVANTEDDLINQQIFVGRERELGQLKAIYDKTVSGQGTVVTIEGEAGVGKSALCEKLAAYVSLRGGDVLRGHCEEASIPYLAFVEAIRSYVISTAVDNLRKNQGSSAPQLARIVPELKQKLKIKLRSSGDPQEERYRLMQAVSDFLANAALTRPLLVVLEDLHEADKSSLDMLIHVARGLAKAPLLIVGTYRDTEIDRKQVLSETLSDIRRISNYHRIKLRELNAEEVGRMVTALTGQKASQDLAKALYEKTEGNPLFVNEVVSYLTENMTGEGKEKDFLITKQMVSEIGIPKELRGVISKRLSKLSTGCNLILSIGAVIGKEFRLDLLKRLAQISEPELFSALREARRAMVVEEFVKVGSDVTYRFSHDFFRKTIYDEILAPERVNLHQQVAKAIEIAYAAHLEEHAVELTEHFSYSQNADCLAKAVTYGEMAAQQAQDVYAHSEAVRLLEHTLKVQEALDPANRVKRFDLLLTLGDALLNEGEPRRILDVEAPKAWSLAEAIRDAGRSSRVCHLAMLALFYYGIGLAWLTPEAALWAERAQRIAQRNTVASARADTATGIVKCSKGFLDEGVPFLSRAMETAKSLGDSDAYWWAAAMWMTYASGFIHDEELLNVAEDLAKSSPDGVSTGVRIWTQIMITDTFLDYAKRPDAEAIWHETQSLIARNGQAHYQVFSMAGNALFAILDGYLEKAVDIINRIRKAGEEMGFADLTERQTFIIGVRALLYLGTVEKTFEHYTKTPSPDDPIKALCLAHLGLITQATDLLENLIAPRYSSQYDETKSETLVYSDVLLLETAVLVGNRKSADLLLRRLDKCKTFTTGIFYATVIDRHMGAAASLLGRFEQAREYYRRALEISTEMRFRPEKALTRFQIAELILAHYPDDRHQALAHLDFAIIEFQDMKMKTSLERALLLKRSLP